MNAKNALVKQNIVLYDNQRTVCSFARKICPPVCKIFCGKGRRTTMMVLHPHHLLCIPRFAGKGYSEEFSRNMRQVSESLRNNPQQPVQLVCRSDVLCVRCPNRRGEECCSQATVRALDGDVLQLCGLQEEDVMPWETLQMLAQKNITDAGHFTKICSRCEWFSFCSTIAGCR